MTQHVTTEKHDIQQELRAAASEERRVVNMRFFKTGPGGYGEGDVFLGVAVPDVRRVVRAHRDATGATIAVLLASPLHEVRLCGALLLSEKCKTYSAKRNANNVLDGDEKKRLRSVYDFYMTHLDRINNWDIVDTSASDVVGRCVLAGAAPRSVLRRLAKSPNLWHRRVAMVATLALIRAGQYDETFAVAALLLGDTHDLTHKAMGWMLREVWKRDAPRTEVFLVAHYARLPRTTLRYAIERMPEDRRKRWLVGNIAA